MTDEDRVEVREDGTRYLVRGTSPIKAKILARQEEWKRQLASLHGVKIRRIAAKKARQRNHGFPPDKSPV